MCKWFKRVTKADVNAVEAKVDQAYKQAQVNGSILARVLDKLTPEKTPDPAIPQRALKTMRRKDAQNFYGGGRT